MPESLEVAEVEAPENEVQESHRIKNFGKNVLGITLGLGLGVGSTYLGYKTGIDLAGENERAVFLDHVNYYGSIALPTAVYGGMGLLGGFYTACAIGGSK